MKMPCEAMCSDEDQAAWVAHLEDMRMNPPKLVAHQGAAPTNEAFLDESTTPNNQLMWVVMTMGGIFVIGGIVYFFVKRLDSAAKKKEKNRRIRDKRKMKKKVAQDSVVPEEFIAALAAAREEWQKEAKAEKEALQQQLNALRDDLNNLKNDVKGIRQGFEPATKYSLLETWVYKRVKINLNEPPGRKVPSYLLHAVAQFASRTLKDLVEADARGRRDEGNYLFSHNLALHVEPPGLDSSYSDGDRESWLSLVWKA